MNKEELLRKIKKVALLKGDFILRSGQRSTEYFDKYLFESQPALMKALCSHLHQLIPSDTQVLAGLIMGGIPLATCLSLETSLPCVFVRKKAKEYGTKKTTEGCSIKNKKVCIVEDIITTGGQVIASAADLRREGAVIEHVLCVIHRGAKEATNNIQKAGLCLSALFTADDFQ